MSDDRSDVSNLTKLSRPPDGIRDVDDLLRRCDCNARDEVGRVRDDGRCSCASDFGPRNPFGFACWGGDGVLRGSHCDGSFDVEGCGEARSDWVAESLDKSAEEGGEAKPLAPCDRDELGAVRVK